MYEIVVVGAGISRVLVRLADGPMDVVSRLDQIVELLFCIRQISIAPPPLKRVISCPRRNILVDCATRLRFLEKELAGGASSRLFCAAMWLEYPLGQMVRYDY